MNNAFMCTFNYVVVLLPQNLFLLIKVFQLDQMCLLAFNNLNSMLALSVSILKWSKNGIVLVCSSSLKDLKTHTHLVIAHFILL
jgi:hypothetical protein